MIAKFLAALIMVESGGDPKEVGDNGKAVGVLQIHTIVIDDVNRIYGTDFRYEDRLDPVMSEKLADFIWHIGVLNTNKRWVKIQLLRCMLGSGMEVREDGINIRLKNIG